MIITTSVLLCGTLSFLKNKGGDDIVDPFLVWDVMK